MTINFSTLLDNIFANYKTTEELKNAANSLCKQINTAYESRYNEIKNTAPKGKDKAATPAPATTKKEKTPKAKGPEKQKDETKSKAADDDETIISITDTKAIKKLGLTFEKYNDRCWVLRGNTKPIRKILKEQFKGVFNSYLTGGEGWIIKTANAQECADTLGIKTKVA